MADIKAFRAWRYDQQVAGPAQTLITQPYDIINQAKQKAYYEANPYNIIRLEWGKTYEFDDEHNNRYSRAAADFSAWKEAAILKQDEELSLYPYVQEYTIKERRYRRRGFLCTIKAAGYGEGFVLPHEATLPAHKEDRYRLMQACLANFSPVFGLYAEENRLVDKALEEASAHNCPLLDVVDEEGVRHLLWQVTDKTVINAVEQSMTCQVIYIADGHHRYETASRFAKDVAAAGEPGCDRLLIHLVNLYDLGLMVLPTHRLAKNLQDYSALALMQALTDMGFAVFPMKDLQALEEGMAAYSTDIAVFGLFSEGYYYLAALDKEDTIIGVTWHGFSEAYRHLDVSIAQSLILEALCGIGSEQLAAGGHIGYSHDALEAVKAVESGEYQFALLLKATPVEDLLAVAAAGEKMPQKSTYFYPKVIAGLAINELKTKTNSL
ncbi:MAG: DUF1015 domain-containing protein [Firmicutes bacterium]|nr:DUF1015 domain-containing protein [Bacillota bacterium]